MLGNRGGDSKFTTPKKAVCVICTGPASYTIFWFSMHNNNVYRGRSRKKILRGGGGGAESKFCIIKGIHSINVQH